MPRRLLVALPALALLLAACSPGGADTNDAAKTQIVASFYPAQFLAEQVGGDLANVQTLTAPGGEPHDLELSAKQIGAVRSADVVIYLEGFQSAVDEAVEQSGRDAASTVDLTDDVTLLSSQGHAVGEEHDDDHGHGHFDPHLWLDPRNLIPATESLAAALGEADPDHRDDYLANARDLIDEFTRLDEEFRAGLATCQRREFVTSHSAFAYLAQAYDLQQISIAGIDPGNEPSTAQLAAITDLVRSEGITTIFTETLAPSALATTVARETGVSTDTLDPIEGLSDETADQDYLTLMRSNLNALQKANDCR